MELTEDGVLMHDGMAVGHIGVEDWPVGEHDMFTSATTIVLDLGQCRMAGVHVRLRDDPEHHHHREGITFER